MVFPADFQASEGTLLYREFPSLLTQELVLFTREHDLGG
jgi:hypothetical protein